VKAELRMKPIKEENSTRQRSLVTFRLGKHICALPIEPVVQIIPMATITPIPQLNSSLKGVINVHGKAVPIINLRHHMGLCKASLRLHAPVILVRNGDGLIGLIVDKVAEVLSLPDDEITDFTDILSTRLHKVPILQGVANVRDSLVLLLDLDHLRLPYQARALLPVQ